jgi:hypothetical protein
MHGDNIKTAAGVPGGFFVHVHQAMVNVVGNDLRITQIMLKTGLNISVEQSMVTYNRKTD